MIDPRVCVRAYACVHMRACVRACVCACVYACVRAYVRVPACASIAVKPMAPSLSVVRVSLFSHGK